MISYQDCHGCHDERSMGAKKNRYRCRFCCLGVVVGVAVRFGVYFFPMATMFLYTTVQLYPFASIPFFLHNCVLRCFSPGFHQRSSHPSLPEFSYSGVGTFLWDFTRALFLYTLCFLASANLSRRWFCLNPCGLFAGFVNVLMMYYVIWCLRP